MKNFDQYIERQTHRFLTAYSRFMVSKNPEDRNEALKALRLRDQAVLNHPDQSERHASFERRLDEGVDYFAAQGELDGAALRIARAA